jgi:stage IV sporulation protein FB
LHAEPREPGSGVDFALRVTNRGLNNAIRNSHSEIRDLPQMLIGEPPPTQADLHFRLFGFPVRVHPFFWLVTFLLGSQADEPTEIFIWVAVVFVSILVHELGHATLQRRFGGHPRITLYSFGGLASCNDCDRSPSRQLAILFAGPLAGFLFAAAVLVTMNLAGHDAGFAISPNAEDVLNTHRAFPINLVGSLYAYLQPFNSRALSLIVIQLIYVNIAWGFLNLLPVYPLDGGQISRELFTLGNPRNGIIQSLQLSIGVAAILAAYFLINERFYTGAMFGYFTYANVQTLRAYRNNWR